jgi:hypothetical protein
MASRFAAGQKSARETRREGPLTTEEGSNKDRGCSINSLLSVFSCVQGPEGRLFREEAQLPTLTEYELRLTVSRTP